MIYLFDFEDFCRWTEALFLVHWNHFIQYCNRVLNVQVNSALQLFKPDAFVKCKV